LPARRRMDRVTAGATADDRRLAVVAGPWCAPRRRHPARLARVGGRAARRPGRPPLDGLAVARARFHGRGRQDAPGSSSPGRPASAAGPGSGGRSVPDGRRFPAVGRRLRPGVGHPGGYRGRHPRPALSAWSETLSKRPTGGWRRRGGDGYRPHPPRDRRHAEEGVGVGVAGRTNLSAAGSARCWAPRRPVRHDREGRLCRLCRPCVSACLQYGAGCSRQWGRMSRVASTANDTVRRAG
jgi:hypothetical protein